MASLVVNSSSPNIVLVNDNLYLFSYDGNSGVSVYSKTGTLVNSSFITGYGTAYGPSSFYLNNFYIPSYTQSKVFKYSSTGVLDSGYTLNVTNPLANTVLDGILYVSTYPSTVVKTFNIISGASINNSFVSGVPGTIASIVAKTTGLYLALENGKISLYNISTGVAINTSFVTGSSTSPYGMIGDAKYLYLADVNGGKVQLYDNATGSFTVTLASGYVTVRGLALDSSYLYFSQAGGSTYKVLNPYYTDILSTVGTAPTITSITNTQTSISVYFTAGTGGSPAPSTYYYSLNGGTYINANSTTSPIVINGLISGVNYNVTLVANNSAGNTVASNMVAGFIPYPCFLQGTKILRMNQETDEEEYVAVEKLMRGDLIKTVNNGYKAIELIGNRIIPRPLDISKPSSRLYWFRKSRISGLREDLCVTGDHCILHKMVSTEKKHQVFAYMGDIFITEDHYRVPAFLDDKAEPYEDADSATIWHFALENSNIYHNYGVMANGCLVESSSLHYMYKYSNMKMG